MDALQVFPGHIMPEQEMNDTLATQINAPQDEASTADGRMTVVFTSSVTQNEGEGYSMVFAQGKTFSFVNTIATWTKYDCQIFFKV